MTQYKLHDIHLSLTKASVLAFVSEGWISCNFYVIMCKKGVFVILRHKMISNIVVSEKKNENE